MTELPVDQHPAPELYIQHAREIQRLARHALRLDSRDATPLAAKISMGLSFQAAELAGKAMLRSLGHDAPEIRKQYRDHDLLKLLREVEADIERRDQSFESLCGFLSRSIVVNGIYYSEGIGEYLEAHFSHGDSARPRNYFYPDEPIFTGPNPIEVVFYIAEQLIDLAVETNATARIATH